MAVDVNLIQVGSGILTLDKDGTDPVIFNATDEGATLIYSRSSQPIEIDESMSPVDYYIDGEECRFELVANEFDAKRLKEAFGHGTITTTAAEAETPGSDSLEFGGSSVITSKPLEYKVKRRVNKNLHIIIELYKVISVSEVESAFTKTGKTGIPLQFMAIPDTTKEEGKQLGKITIETEEPVSA